MQKKKILLLGATGMAGHMVYFYLKETAKYEITNVAFRDKLTEDSLILDVKKDKIVSEEIRKFCPDIIINCIGVLQRGSKDHPDNAIYLNAYFPHLLKHLSDEINAKLIHISTDCVFSGKKGNYSETDFRDADDIYGRSKALGEIISDKDLTLRTSIIGPEIKKSGEGLFHWFMMQRGEINGFRSAIWSGVTTLELSKSIDKGIENNLNGLIHVSNGTGIDKYTLLNLFKEIWDKRDVSILEDRLLVIDKSIQKSARFDFQIPSYKEMLKEQFDWMNNHENLYIQYIK